MSTDCPKHEAMSLEEATISNMWEIAATRKHPMIRPFYQRLCQARKATKLALTACIRKLLTNLNAYVPLVILRPSVLLPNPAETFCMGTIEEG
ncbi:MAG: hypothetical protein HP490_13165 [Nitrospira sp.]|nr:hypothetical protein [Nitrospira sp.]